MSFLCQPYIIVTNSTIIAQDNFQRKGNGLPSSLPLKWQWFIINIRRLSSSDGYTEMTNQENKGNIYSLNTYINLKMYTLTDLQWTHWSLGDFKEILGEYIFQLIIVIGGWRVSYKIVLKWMPMDLTDGKSTLVQVMAWCRQATRNYRSQCWPRSLLPYGVIRDNIKDNMKLKLEFSDKP